MPMMRLTPCRYQSGRNTSSNSGRNFTANLRKKSQCSCKKPVMEGPAGRTFRQIMRENEAANCLIQSNYADLEARLVAWIIDGEEDPYQKLADELNISRDFAKKLIHLSNYQTKEESMDIERQIKTLVSEVVQSELRDFSLELEKMSKRIDFINQRLHKMRQIDHLHAHHRLRKDVDTLRLLFRNLKDDLNSKATVHLKATVETPDDPTEYCEDRFQEIEKDVEKLKAAAEDDRDFRDFNFKKAFFAWLGDSGTKDRTGQNWTTEEVEQLVDELHKVLGPLSHAHGRSERALRERLRLIYREGIDVFSYNAIDAVRKI